MQTMPGTDDNTNVAIFDHLKMANESYSGEASSEGLYSDFEVHMLNDDLSADEIEYFKDMNDFEPVPFIVLSFTNPDEDE